MVIKNYFEKSDNFYSLYKSIKDITKSPNLSLNHENELKISNNIEIVENFLNQNMCQML